ncbi:unnamed protein product [Lactuca virosa]|uniref:Uncharacterized protein n=1 Tax=Lactuca virosa TaxID=75947 RepID=A0AAU9LY85_9ASTR|nr:unnamed protein product [Lactuca virosa]
MPKPIKMEEIQSTKHIFLKESRSLDQMLLMNTVQILSGGRLCPFVNTIDTKFKRVAIKIRELASEELEIWIRWIWKMLRHGMKGRISSIFEVDSISHFLQIRLNLKWILMGLRKSHGDFKILIYPTFPTLPSGEKDELSALGINQTR